MSTLDEFAALPAEDQAQIESICEDYESDWASSAAPDLENALAKFEGEKRAILLRELLEIERYYRSQSLGRKVDDFEILEAHASVADELRGELSRMQQSDLETMAVDPGQFGSTGLSGLKNTASPGLFDRLPVRFGRYEILQQLGAGGMGSVYLAEDSQLERRVALKLPHLNPAQEPLLVARFYREAKAAAAIHHPNLCAVYDAGMIDNVHYFTMEFIEGDSLAAVIRSPANISQQRAATLIQKMALALQEAHEQGIVHRDLKPSNVMINHRGEPVITDFGLAQREEQSGDRLTHSGAILGTPAYMSPEQVNATTEVGPASDIYSLGVILYEMLTLKPPFVGSTAAVFGKILTEEATPLSSIQSDINPALAAICHKMMAKRIEDRFTSMAEVAEALEGWLQAERAAQATTASTPDPIEVAQPTTSRRRKLVGSLAALALLLVAGLWLASTILKVSTEHGTIAVQIEGSGKPIDIDVSQDNELTIIDPNDGQKIKVSIDRETSQLRLEKQGFQVVLSDFSLKTPDGRRVSVLFIPKQKTVAGGDGGTGTTHPPGWSTLPPNAPPPAIAPFDAEQARQHQQAWARYLGVPVEREIDLGKDKDNVPTKLTLVLIPPGEYQMGTSESDFETLLAEAKAIDELYAKFISLETPQHRVRITQPFWLSRHEVTLAHFGRFVAATEYVTDPERNAGGWGFVKVDDEWTWGQDARFLWNSDLHAQPQYRFVYPQTAEHPVIHVSWNDATQFCRWVTTVANGPVFSLPTEAQWEYACRAGTTSSWAYGNDAEQFPQYGWGSVNSRHQAHPVGQLRPNAFGLYDMHGNVAEWCQDRLDEDYYASSPVNDPQGSLQGDRHLHRGGNFHWKTPQTRSAHRAFAGPNYATIDIGFRVAAPIDLPGKPDPSVPQNPEPVAANDQPLAREREIAGWIIRHGGELFAQPLRGPIIGPLTDESKLPDQPFYVQRIKGLEISPTESEQLQQVGQLQALQELDFSQGSCPAGALEKIQFQSDLNRLTIARSGIQAAELATCTGLERLNVLDLDARQVDDWSFLKHLPRLRMLKMDGATNQVLSQLAESQDFKNSPLRRLQLGGMATISDSQIARLQAVNPDLTIQHWMAGHVQHLGKDVQELALIELLKLGFEVKVFTNKMVRLTAADQLPDEAHANIVAVEFPPGFEVTAESVNLLDRLSPVISITADSITNTHLLIESLDNRWLQNLTLTNTDLTEADFKNLLEAFPPRVLIISGGKLSEETVRALKPKYPLLHLETDYGVFPVNAATD